MGQEMEEWLESDDNIEQWESTEKGIALTVSERRILLAKWFSTGFQRACEGTAIRKYFEHAGALLTADGSDDHLIQLEGAPKDYTLVIPS